MKHSPDNQINASFIDNQINASFIDISRIYCGRLSSAQLDRWQAPKQRPISVSITVSVRPKSCLIFTDPPIFI